MPDVRYRVDAQSVSKTRMDVNIRDLSLVIDEPEKLGGTNAGPNPIELELASLAGCINVTGHVVARELGMKINTLSVSVTGTLNPAKFSGRPSDERAGYKEIVADVTLESDADEKTQAEWIEKVEERCPVSDNLSNGTRLVVRRSA